MLYVLSLPKDRRTQARTVDRNLILPAGHEGGDGSYESVCAALCVLLGGEGAERALSAHDCAVYIGTVGEQGFSCGQVWVAAVRISISMFILGS